jgi:hypothetical protein
MAKKTSKLPAAGGRKVSLKKIVAEIDKALGQIEKKPKPTSTQGTQAVARTKLALRAARDAVESACMPGFNVPGAD